MRRLDPGRIDGQTDRVLRRIDECLAIVSALIGRG